MSETKVEEKGIKTVVDKLNFYTALKSSMVIFGFTNRVINSAGGWEALSDTNKAAAASLFSSGIMLLLIGVKIAKDMRNK